MRDRLIFAGQLLFTLLIAAFLPMSTPRPVAAVACDPDPFCAEVTIDYSGNGSGTVVDRNEPAKSHGQMLDAKHDVAAGLRHP